MPSKIIAVALDCVDTDELSRFWSAVFGTGEVSRWADADGTEYVEIGTGLGATLLLQPVPEAKRGKNRLHLDLAPATGDQDDEVRRLVALGATVVSDEERHRWVVMADPEGNEFCVLPPR
ncbi:VOC family protein [Labedaea rhizosphaerae]|uniref:Putative enzyme related to lactoylglutathione lyase n=1 Tax=Labedaea rhizosphaerae TaxID=598644 RepID=A0A4R6RVU9_LABRH|nr:VOC family protein [Labedaea rhizosphaerae]TDP91063.1 putative enzyme related to lactoylglutathione lyase [Labedaea rhizosphaerae]